MIRQTKIVHQICQSEVKCETKMISNMQATEKISFAGLLAHDQHYTKSLFK